MDSSRLCAQKIVLCLIVISTCGNPHSAFGMAKTIARTNASSLIHSLNNASQKYLSPEKLTLLIALSIYAPIWIGVGAKLYRKAYPSLRAHYMQLRQEELKQALQQLAKDNAMLDALFAKVPAKNNGCLYDVAPIIGEFLNTKHHVLFEWLSEGFPPRNPAEYTQLEAVAPFLPFVMVALAIPAISLRQTLQKLDEKTEEQDAQSAAPSNNPNPNGKNPTNPYLIPFLHIATMILMVANGMVNQ